jgi:hypothetical protein
MRAGSGADATAALRAATSAGVGASVGNVVADTGGFPPLPRFPDVVSPFCMLGTISPPASAAAADSALAVALVATKTKAVAAQ